MLAELEPGVGWGGLGDGGEEIRFAEFFNFRKSHTVVQKKTGAFSKQANLISNGLLKVVLYFIR